MKHQQQQQHLLFPTYKLWTCSPNAHMFSYQAQAQANFCCLFKDQADDTIACSAIERATPTIQTLTQKLQNRVKPFFLKRMSRRFFSLFCFFSIFSIVLFLTFLAGARVFNVTELRTSPSEPELRSRLGFDGL